MLVIQFFTHFSDIYSFYSFQCVIHSLRGATKLFWLVLLVLDAAYSAIAIQFSTSFIRKMAPLVVFGGFVVFPPKRPRPFFLYRPHQKTLFRMMEFTQKLNFVLRSQ